MKGAGLDGDAGKVMIITFSVNTTTFISHRTLYSNQFWLFMYFLQVV